MESENKKRKRTDPEKKQEYNRRYRLKQGSLRTSMELSIAMMTKKIKELEEKEMKYKALKAKFKAHKLFNGRCVCDRAGKETVELMEQNEQRKTNEEPKEDNETENVSELTDKQ